MSTRASQITLSSPSENPARMDTVREKIRETVTKTSRFWGCRCGRNPHEPAPYQQADLHRLARATAEKTKHIGNREACVTSPDCRLIQI